MTKNISMSIGVQSCPDLGVGPSWRTGFSRGFDRETPDVTAAEQTMALDDARSREMLADKGDDADGLRSELLINAVHGR